ncbi:hypothetical protein M3Y94_01308400 [Aphelenchoides besseyi]|nr:hypothetical protein M3Y94_01308400 [Aphelenchoides besseyi]
MIVERVPDFLSSPKDSDQFAFDKDGRFVYVWRYVDDIIISLLVYDIKFNDYVELTPDPSFSKLKRPNYDGVWFANCLPVCAEQLLAAYKIDEIYNIMLIGIDFQQRTFGVLDTSPPVFDCFAPTLVRDEDVFGLFYSRVIPHNNKDNKEPKESRDFYAFIKFTIQANRIKMDEKMVRFGYQIWSHTNNWSNKPRVLHLYQNKLWFVRTAKGSLRPPQSAILLPPRAISNYDYNLSYFDLNDENPTEKLVRTLDLSHLVEPNISQFNWVKDTLILQLTETQLELFNMNTFEWSTMDTNLDLCWTEDTEYQMKENWVNYRRLVNRDFYLAEFSPIHVDNHFARISVNRKSGHLHRVPLREPFKLKDLAWTVVLNAGVLSSNRKLPKKLPYSRVF